MKRFKTQQFTNNNNKTPSSYCSVFVKIGDTVLSQYLLGLGLAAYIRKPKSQCLNKTSERQGVQE